ncbi:MAG: hypothetical protein LOD94_13350, partial [Gammaproteobacteria bacterium]
MRLPLSAAAERLLERAVRESSSVERKLEALEGRSFRVRVEGVGLDLTLRAEGGRVRVISTHNGEQNPFNELINDIRAGRRRGSVQRITFREAVDQGLYRRVCLRLGQAWTAEDEAEWVRNVYEYYGEDATEELDVIPQAGDGVP